MAETKQDAPEKLAPQISKKNVNIRMFVMIIILIFVTATDILLDYVNAGFDPSIFTRPAYWIELSLAVASIVLVTLTARDFFREREIIGNSAVTKTQQRLDNTHNELRDRNLTARFEEYINNINRERKLEAYKNYLQFKITKCRSDKKRKKWTELLNRAEADVGCIPTRGNVILLSRVRHIHYNKVRISTIFSRVGQSAGDDEDLETNEGRSIRDLLGRKIIPFLAYTVTIGMLVFTPGEFTTAILINTFSKVFRIATSVYIGSTDGQSFVRGTLLSKMKLRLDLVQKFIDDQHAAAPEPKKVGVATTAPESAPIALPAPPIILPTATPTDAPTQTDIEKKAES